MDVVIGTHAVLSKIECRHLGLLVVDEEQRFGVMQKEKWKSWSKKLDVLTLSATPIPHYTPYESYRCAGYGGDDTAAGEPPCDTDLCDRVR